MSGGRAVNNPAFPPIINPSGNYKTLQADTLRVNNILGDFSAWKEPVRAATTANIILSGGQNIDNVIVVLGDRILVKNQTTGSENGIYITSNGTWSRSNDMPIGSDASSTTVFIKEGSNYADNQAVCTNDKGVGIIGTDALVFSILTSTPPGGSDTQIQYNNSNTFAGDSNLTWTSGSSQLGATNILSTASTTGTATITTALVTVANITTTNSTTLVNSGLATISGGVDVNADIIGLTIGTGSDLTMGHDGSNSSLTNITGDLVIDNTGVTNSIVNRLGTDTNVTDFQIQNDSETALFTVDGSGLVTVGNKITGVTNPTTDLDVSNKAYVDAIAVGLGWKDSVCVATTIDGNQTDGTENGVYTVNATGVPTRTSDMPNASDASGNAMFVQEGTTNNGRGFVCSNITDSAVVGTDSLVFVQFNGVSNLVQGSGIDITSNTVSVDTTVVRTTGTQSVNGVKTFTSTPEMSVGVNILADSQSLTVGVGSDFALLHNGTDTVATNVTGDLILDNTSSTGSSIFRTGTDTSTTDFQIQNDSETALFTVDGSGLTTVSDRITGVATPTETTDAVNKAYVDNNSWKNKVVVATTANGILGTDFENGDNVDGVVISTGDRILIKEQTTATENGIYTVNVTGAPTRSQDLDTGSDAASIVVTVNQGTINSDKVLVNTNDSGSAVVGTDTLSFSQISGSITAQWATYTPVVSASFTAPILATNHNKFASYLIIDKSLQITWQYNHIFGTGATNGFGQYYFNLPPGVTIDTSLVAIGSLTTGNDYSTVGNGTVIIDGNSSALSVICATSTQLMLRGIFTTGPAFGILGNFFFAFSTSNYTVMFTASVPII